MSNKYESMIGIMKLYDLRREPVMREARAWFDAFYADSPADIEKVFSGEDDRFFRMVLTYWDMAATFVNHGAIDAVLFNEANVEHVAVYAKVEPFIDNLRALTKEPKLLANLEKLVSAIPDAKEKTARFRERAKTRRAATAGTAAVA